MYIAMFVVYNAFMRKVLVIVGPTSSGKTSLSVKLCEKFGGEIISADSRQVYKDMDIGTGKVPVGSMAKIKELEDHWELDATIVWGYDLATPDEYFTVYDYAKWSIPKIEGLLGEGKTPFLVGGTGFYTDVVTGIKTVAGAKPDFELRKSLETTTTKSLVTRLTSLNPEVAERLDLNNRARLIRALEVELTKEKNTTPLPRLNDVEFIFVGLTAPRDFLYDRVDKWLDTIWDNGLIEEAKILIKKYPKSRLLNGLVYKSVVSFIKEETSEEEARQRAKYDLHSYIRRQQTWFKKNEDIKWFDVTDKNFGKQVEEHVIFHIDG
jgi:tRNA dimethylallyltransferase